MKSPSASLPRPKKYRHVVKDAAAARHVDCNDNLAYMDGREPRLAHQHTGIWIVGASRLRRPRDWHSWSNSELLDFRSDMEREFRFVSLLANNPPTPHIYHQGTASVQTTSTEHVTTEPRPARTPPTPHLHNGSPEPWRATRIPSLRVTSPRPSGCSWGRQGAPYRKSVVVHP